MAKDAAGNVTNYQSNAITTIIIDQNQTLKKFTVNEKFNFQKMSDKYEEKSYEENIKKKSSYSNSSKAHSQIVN